MKQDLSRSLIDEQIGRPILEALSFAHGRRVWHRDLKPANVLLDTAGRPKLADFSIAKVDQRWDPSRTVGAFGSPPFTAPENDDGIASGGRDCWIYAAIALYCLTQIQFKDYGDIQRAGADRRAGTDRRDPEEMPFKRARGSTGDRDRPVRRDRKGAESARSGVDPAPPDPPLPQS